jgi:hypothetical protein
MTPDDIETKRKGRCCFNDCSLAALFAVAGTSVCAGHFDRLKATVEREASLDYPYLPRFRFVRRRGGYETWFTRSRSSRNLTAFDPEAYPLAKLAVARANARARARRWGCAFVDEERVLSRETLKSLFSSKGAP